MDGCFHVGEMRDLWRILAQALPMPCGCGRQLADCPVWSRVLSADFDGSTLAARAPDIYRAQQAVRTPRLPWLLRAPERSLADSEAGHYRQALSATYAALRRVTGAETVVDTSKAPAEAALVMRMTDRRIGLVHLTRDPRAVAFAWSRPKLHLRRYGVVASSARWLKDNAATELVRRAPGAASLRLRYEDFVADPERALREVLGLIGRGDAVLPLAGNQVTLPPNHTVSGNPDRAQSGEITIREERRWKAALGWRRRLLVEATTLPLRRRYGY